MRTGIIITLILALSVWGCSDSDSEVFCLNSITATEVSENGAIIRCDLSGMNIDSIGYKFSTDGVNFSEKEINANIYYRNNVIYANLTNLYPNSTYQFFYIASSGKVTFSSDTIIFTTTPKITGIDDNPFPGF